MRPDRAGPDRTAATLAKWLAPARDRFGTWTLRELEGAADDIARRRAKLPTEHARYKHTRALRQVLEAAKRWRYTGRNPAAEAGANPQPRGEEVWPFTREELDATAAELVPRDAAIVVFAAETGLRTNGTATDRCDVAGRNSGRRGRPPVRRRQTQPVPEDSAPPSAAHPAGTRSSPPRLDTTILFAGDKGGHLNLNNWRNRIWYPALAAAGVDRRGPYSLRHIFATNALAAGVSVWQLSRRMRTSVEMIERHYGHMARDSEDALRALLSARSGDDLATADGADA